MDLSRDKENWDRCWQDLANQPWYPDEQVVRFLARYVTRKTGFATTDTKRVLTTPRPAGLDLGCGKGRHVVLLAELDLEAHGYDLSPMGLEFARQWLGARGLKGELKEGSIDKLPYSDKKFDFTICHGVLDHAVSATRQAAYREIVRTLKDGGLFFASFISEHDSAYGKGKLVEPETWMINEGYESDLPQAFFTLDRIKSELSPFEIESIVRCDSESLQGRSLIGTDKHYARDSRYYVTAKKRK